MVFRAFNYLIRIQVQYIQSFRKVNYLCIFTTENTVSSLDLLNGSSNVANRDSSGALASCEDILAKEIQNATITLQNLSQQQHDLQGKLMYIRYIRECAETIQALKGLKKA